MNGSAARFMSTRPRIAAAIFGIFIVHSYAPEASFWRA
jgi:hypothetical protein